MQNIPQITFLHLDSSDSLEGHIRKKIEKLDYFFDGIIGCRVTVALPHQHHHRGRHFQIRIDIQVPGEEIVVNRDPSDDPAHEDAHVAVDDAFNAATRQLQDYIRKKRGR